MLNYNLENIISEGAYGKVWKAKRGEKDVAIKQLDAFNSVNISELDITRKVSHPNIIIFLDIFYSERNFYYVMPIAKTSLRKYVPKGGLLSNDYIRTFSFELISAINYLHKKGIFHCDVKPDNILIFEKDGEDTLVLADMGLAQYLNNEVSICQTIIYAAPELYKYHDINLGVMLGDENKLNRSTAEIFSIGAVMLFMITGENPFLPLEGENFRSQMIDFVSDHKKYIDEKLLGHTDEFTDILYATMEPRQEDRIKTTIEILQNEVFLDFNFDVPTPGLDLQETNRYGFSCSDNLKLLVSWILEVCRHLNLRIVTTITAIDIVYRSQKVFVKRTEDLQLLACSAIIISAFVLENYGESLFPELQRLSRNIFTEEELRASYIRLIGDLQGILYLENVYDYAVSLDMLKKYLEVFLVCDKFLAVKDDLPKFKYDITQRETKAQMRKRANKDVKVSSISSFLSQFINK